jgi:hypothetical protein
LEAGTEVKDAEEEVEDDNAVGVAEGGGGEGNRGEGDVHGGRCVEGGITAR